MLASILLLGAHGVPGRAQVDLTQPGPTERSCQSSFAVGYSACTRPAAQAPTAATVAATVAATQPTPAVQSRTGTTERTVGQVTDAEVDAYLANHGKPSREAARALLDPTDENIAAMARKFRQEAAVASYVAGRMTAMQEIDPGLVALNPVFNSEDLPMLSGMRLVLHIAPGCKPCENAVLAIQRLVAESPILDARVVVHGVSDPKAMTLEMARIGITLPSVPASPGASRYARLVPIAVLADTRFGKEGLLSKFGNTQEIRSSIAGFRRTSMAQSPGK